MEQHKEKDREHHEKKKGLSSSFYRKVIILLSVGLVLFALYNIFQVSSFSTLFDKKLAEAKEAARPAKIQLVTIQNQNCKDCFDIIPIVEAVKKFNINITKEENLSLGSDKAKELIDKYNIEKIPTVLLFGEINKTRINSLEERNDTLVFTELSPPYTDAESNQIRGRVSAVILRDSSCDKCTNLTPVLEQIKRLGVTIISEKVLEKDNQEGQGLIKKYSVERLPTLILSKDLKVYSSDIIRAMNQVGSVEEDGSYITREIAPPYLDLNTNRVIGLVSMTVLIDDSCGDCYDPDKFHKPILQRMGVVFKDEKRIDISSSKGQELVDKYKIKKAPTIILEGDVEEYPILVNAWKDVGTVENDGIYVFRKVEVAQQAYKDLSTNKIINPQTTS